MVYNNSSQTPVPMTSPAPNGTPSGEILGHHKILPPFSAELKVDVHLRLKPCTFQERIQTNVKKTSRSEREQLDRVPSYPSPYEFAQLSFAAYKNKEYYESHMDYERRLQLPIGWIHLTSASNRSIENGYFGCAFLHPENRHVVIAHRGTKLTSLGAFWSDAVGVVCKNPVSQMDSAVTFAHYVTHVLKALGSTMKVHFELFFTGHSLGGWLAQITAFTIEYLHPQGRNFRKNDSPGLWHPHVVVFESPGCAAMLERLTDSFDVRYGKQRIDPECLDITTYLAAPNRINSCNKHVGSLYRIFPDLRGVKWRWWSFNVEYNPAVHKIKRILACFDPITGQVHVDENNCPKLREVVDWPISGFIVSGSEYRWFFQWANQLNDYHTAGNETLGWRPSIRYQTIPEIDKLGKICRPSAFSSREHQFLVDYLGLCEFVNPDTLLPDLHTSSHQMLQTFHISGNGIQSEDLQRSIPYVRTLVRLFPLTVQKVAELSTADGRSQQVYKTETQNVVQVLQRQYFLDLNKPINELNTFLSSEKLQLWHAQFQECPQMGLSILYTYFKRMQVNDYLDPSRHSVIGIEKFLYLTVERRVDVWKGIGCNGHLLIIRCDGLNDYSKAGQLLKEVLKRTSQAKVILVSQETNCRQPKIEVDIIQMLRIQGVPCSHTVHRSIRWDDLTNDSQLATLRSITLNFQGEKLKLPELVGSKTVLTDFRMRQFLACKFETPNLNTLQRKAQLKSATSRYGAIPRMNFLRGIAHCV